MKPHPNDIKREQDRIWDLCLDRMIDSALDDAGRVKLARLDARRGWVRGTPVRVLHGKEARK